MNTKAFSIAPLLFGAFAILVICLIVFLIGKEAIKSDVESKVVQPEVQVSVIEAVKSILAKKKNLTHETGWHSVEFLPTEWASNDVVLYIRYYAQDDKEPLRFFVITHPKEQIGGLDVSVRQPPIVLGLGGWGTTYPINAGSGYKSEQKIISGFGVVHTINSTTENYMELDPAITEAESERNYLWVVQKNASVQSLILEPK